MANYSVDPVHKNPTMDAYGTFNAWRDGNNIRITGTASLHKGGRIWSYVWLSLCCKNTLEW